MSISFSGLASGLDTSSWIQSLTALKQAKVTTLQEKRAAVVATKDTLSSIRSFFSSFRTTLEKITDSRFNLVSMNLFKQNLATSANLKVLSATATSEAEEGKYEVKVDKLASNTEATSKCKYTTTIVETTTASGDTLLKDIGNGVKSGIIKVNGTELYISSSDSINDFINKLDGLGVRAEFNVKTGVFSASINANNIDDVDGTGIVEALHLSTVNNSYVSGDLTVEQEEEDVVAELSTCIWDILDINSSVREAEDVLGDDTDGNKRTLRIKTGEDYYDIILDSDETIGSLVNDINAELGAQGVSASFTNGIFKLSNAQIMSDGDTNFIKAFGLNNAGNVDVSQSSQQSAVIVGGNTTTTETATESTYLTALQGGTGITDSDTVVVEDDEGNETTISLRDDMTLGELLQAMRDAGLEASISEDGIISISDGTITGGTVDIKSILGLTETVTSGGGEPVTTITGSNQLFVSIAPVETTVRGSTTLGSIGVEDTDTLNILDSQGNVIYSGSNLAEITIDEFLSLCSTEALADGGSLEGRLVDGVITFNSVSGFRIEGSVATKLGLTTTSEPAQTTTSTIGITLTSTEVITQTFGFTDVSGATALSEIADMQIQSGQTYAISTTADLQALAEVVNGGNSCAGATFVMTNDIDLSSIENWTAIGNNSTHFSGTFDGNGYEITGLNIDSTSKYQGLFGWIDHATIKNLGITGYEISGYTGVGALAGAASYSTITNVYTEGTISATSNGVGGLVGSFSNGTITSCQASGTIESTSYYVGGLVGSISYATIVSSSSDANVKGAYYVGGIAGYGQGNGKYISVYSSGTITATNSTYANTAGGIIGYAYGNNTIQDSYTKATVSSGGGSIAGSVKSSYTLAITNSQALSDNYVAYANANTTTTGCSVLAADETPFTINPQNSVQASVSATTLSSISDYQIKSGHTYKISTTADLQALATIVNGGNTCTGATFVMTNDIDLSSIENWTAIGNYSNNFSGTFDGNGYEITGLNINSTVAGQGLFGYIRQATIKNLGITGYEINGRLYVGALAGNASYSTITNVYTEGTISATDSHVGGLVGYLDGGTITSCQASGTIESTSSDVGGLAGFGDSYTITSSSSDANVKGTCNVGGIVGRAFDSGKYISVYSSGTITATDSTKANTAGGIVGCICDHTTIQDSYTKATVSSGGGAIAGSVSSSYTLAITNCQALSDNYVAVPNANTTTTGCSTITADETPFTISAKKTALATNTTTFGQIGLDSNAEITIVSAGTESVFTVETGTTVEQLQSHLQGKGFTASFVDGILTIAGADGVYIKGDLDDRIDAVLNFEDVGNCAREETVTLGNSSATVGVSQSSSTIVTYTESVTANLESTLAELGVSEYQLNVYNSDGTLSNEYSTVFASGTKLESILNHLSTAGINATLDNGIITVNSSTEGRYIQGGLAEALGISATEQVVGSVTVGKTLTSATPVTYQKVDTATGDSKLSEILNDMSASEIQALTVVDNNNDGTNTNYTLEQLAQNNYSKSAQDLTINELNSIFTSLGSTATLDGAGRIVLTSNTNNYITGTLADALGISASSIITSTTAAVDQTSTEQVTYTKSVAISGTTLISDFYTGTNSIITVKTSSGIIHKNVDSLTALSAVTASAMVSGATFKISTTADLLNLATIVNGGTNCSGVTFVMANDIDLSSIENWTAIGNNSSSFHGIFDGNGYEITGLNIDSTSSYQGLFGYIQNATIKNLGITGYEISGISYVGALAGYASNSTITNVYTEGTISATGGVVGGLVGFFNIGTITSCQASGTIESTSDSVGGLVGDCGGTIVSSSSETNVVGTYNVGGIVGSARSLKCISVYSSGTITATDSTKSNTAGGLVGVYGYGTINIENAYFKGSVSSGGEIAGTNTTAGSLTLASVYAVTDNYVASGASYTDNGGNGVITADETPFTININPNLANIDISGMTVDEMFSALSSYDVTGSVADGVISFTSTAGNYVTGAAMDAWGIGTSVSTSGETVANKQTSSSVITYNTTANVSSASLISKTYDLTDNKIVVKSGDGQTDIGTVTITSTMTFEDMFYELSSLGVNGTISNAVITFTSEDGYYVTGGAITAWGIGTTSSTETSTAVVDQTSTEQVTYTQTMAISGTTEISEFYSGTDSIITVKTSSGMLIGATDTSGMTALSAVADKQIISGRTYAISTTADLQALAEVVNGGISCAGVTFVMTNNIDLSSIENWTPIGDYSNKFSGTFNGNGYEITGMKIDSTSDYQGLFGNVQNATIKNLGITGYEISGRSYVGALAGRAPDSTIINVYTEGTISATGTYVGGLVGTFSSGRITSCQASGTIESTSYSVGGLVGSGSGTIISSSSDANVTGSYNVGGIAGLGYGKYISVYSSGTITATNSTKANTAGGIVGSAQSNTTIQDSYTKATVSSGGGAIAGSVSSSNTLAITNSQALSNNYVAYANANTTTTGCSVLAADETPFTINAQNAVQASVSATTLSSISDYVIKSGQTYKISTTAELQALANIVSGGNTCAGATFILENDIDLSSIENWTAIGTSSNAFFGTFDGNGYEITGLNIDSTSNYQGLFGYIDEATIKNLGITGYNINGKNNVGALAGYASNSTITNVYTEGTISAAGSAVGGLVGNLIEGTITSCQASGTINSASYYVGGLVGSGCGTIVSSSSDANVKGAYSVGGIVGNGSSSEYIISVYSSGTITATDSNYANRAGGIIGYGYSNITIQDSYTKATVSSGGGAIAGSVSFSYYTIAITNSQALSDNYVAAPNANTTTTGCSVITADETPFTINPRIYSHIDISGMTVDEMFSALSSYDVTGSLSSDGVISFTSSDGNIVTGAPAEAWGITTTDDIVYNSITSSGTLTVATTWKDLGFNYDLELALYDVSTQAITTITIANSTTMARTALILSDYNIGWTVSGGKLTVDYQGNYVIDTMNIALLRRFELSTANHYNVASTTVYSNTPSNTVKETITNTILGTTTLDKIGYDSGDSSVWTILNKTTGATVTIQPNRTGTLNDLANTLSAYDINLTLSNGEVTIESTGNYAISGISGWGSTELGLPADEASWVTVNDTSVTYNTDSNTLNEEKTFTLTDATTWADLGATGTFMIGLTNLNTGTNTSELINSSLTFAETAQNLYDQYGIQLSVTDGIVKIDYDNSTNGDRYIINNNIFSKSWANYVKVDLTNNPTTINTTTTWSNSTSDSLTATVTKTLASDTTFGELGLSSQQELEIVNNGVTSTVTVDASTSMADFMNSLTGFTCSISDGKITIAGANGVYIKESNAEIFNVLNITDGTTYTENSEVGYVNGSSNQLNVNNTASITNDTTFAQLGVVSDNNEIVVNKNGVALTITIDSTDTVGSLVTQLNNAMGTGAAEIRDGKFYLNTIDGAYISSIDSDIANALKISANSNDYSSEVITASSTTIVSGELKVLGEGSKEFITVDTELGDIIDSEGNPLSDYILDLGDAGSYTFDANTTIQDVIDRLQEDGITATLDNGVLTITANGNMTLGGGLGSLIAGSNPNITVTPGEAIENVEYSGSSLLVSTTTSMSITEATKLVDIEIGGEKITAGNVKVVLDGVTHNIAMTSSDTIGSLIEALGSIGVTGTLTDVAGGKAIELNYDGEIILSDGAGSNIVEKLFPNGFSQKINSTSDIVMKDVTTTTLVAAQTSDLLSNFYSNPHETITVEITSAYDTVTTTMTIAEDETIGSLMEKFESIGVVATLWDGKLTLNALDKNISITPTSKLATNLLTGPVDVEDITASMDRIDKNIAHVIETSGSVAEFADLSTKIGSLGVSSGSFSVLRNGVKATVMVDADQTFEHLRNQIQAEFSDVDLRFKDGRLEIYSETDGVEVKAGFSNDTSNIISTLGLNLEGDLVRSKRELYKIIGESKLMEEGLFKLGDVTAGTFIIGNAEFTIDENTTLNDIIKQINSSSETNATAYWDPSNGKFVIKSRVTGSSLINVEARTSNFTDIIGLTASEWNPDGTLASTRLLTDNQELGGNAKFSIDGTEFTSTSNIVGSDITKIKGLTLDLKGVSNGESVTVVVEKDYNSAADALQEVVDAYNALIENVDAEVAIGGDLKGESTLKLLRNQIRSTMMSSLGGVSQFKTLNSVGISTEAASANNISTANINKLSFDKEKFIEAFRADSEAVEHLLVGNDVQQGILTRVENVVESSLKAVTGYFASAENSYNNQISRLDAQIERANTAVARYKSRLEQKFQYMDMMIAKMQEQFSTFLGT